MKIAMITAGGAGMFCGSCMQDNTLVRTLRMVDVDAVLVPAYTPIRVDEENASSERVFLGGINVYLDSAIPFWSKLPHWLTGWLNWPSVIRWLSKFGTSTDAAKLGPLTLDMLRGDAGPQRREIDELVRFLVDDLNPDVVLLSNALISGLLPQLRRSYRGKILILLQGDDIFLEGLPERYRTEAIRLIAENCRHIDGFMTHSQFYADFMQSYLHLEPAKFEVIPLTVDTSQLPDFSAPVQSAEPRFRVGYFARICPEKGAFRFLSLLPELLSSDPQIDAVIAGFLPEQHRARFEKQLSEVQKAVPQGRIHWAGSPSSRPEKFNLLMSLNVLCVPAEYREPKGIYVLEAGLAGVPVVVPSHGAFPERIQDLGSGRLASPKDSGEFIRSIRDLKQEYGTISHLAAEVGSQARRILRDHVIQRHSMQATGQPILEAITRLTK